MILKVKVHPNSSKEKIKEVTGGLEIWIKARAEDNKANIALVKLLKRHFNKEVVIKSGFTSKNKIIEIK